jgi:hypothetical protein
MKTLQEQVKCVERELTYRRRVYARWVSRGKMTTEQAEHEIETMQAVLKTVRDAALAEPILGG